MLRLSSLFVSAQRVFARQFSEVTSSRAPGIVPELPDIAKARTEAVAYRKNAIGSNQKLNELCYIVRRMNTTEALAQLQFSARRKYAGILSDTIKSAVRNASHNFGMDASRLLIVRADVGRAPPMKRIKIHGRSKMGIMQRGRCHLRVVVREVPVQEGEERLGVRGRRTATVKGDSHPNGRKEKWARRRKEYASIVPQFDTQGRPVGSPIADYLSKVKVRENNPKEWLRNMRLRIPPTDKAHKHPEIRAFAPGSRPLQPNGGYASTTGKGERSLLKTVNPNPIAFKGVSAALEEAIKKAVAAKKKPVKKQSSTRS